MKKRLILTSVISIILVVVLLIGTTYSLFETSNTDDNLNVYQTGVLDVTYIASADKITFSTVSLENEDDIIIIPPYRITVKNTGNVAYKFDLKLNDTTATDTIDYDYIMTKVGKLEPKSLSDCNNNIIKSNIIVPAKKSVDIDIRVYLSQDVANTEIGKSFYANLLVEGLAVYTETDDIDNSILAFPVGEDFKYTGSVQEYVVPVSGFYQLEAWGAAGGSYNATNYGGKGAYTTGLIELTEGTKLYVYVGGEGPAEVTQTNIGGYNGGGYSGSYSGYNSSGGGGATDIRLVGGTWNDFNSLKSRIMVAAGGGGTALTTNYTTTGGYGGALTGGSGDGTYSSETPTGGTQTSTGTGHGTSYLGTFGYGLQSNTSGWGGGAGGGYYAGVNGFGKGGSGGSSYISGHDGCNAITEASTSTSITHTGSSEHYSGYVFLSSLMIAGNASMPKYDKKDEEQVGNKGNGYARIAYVGNSVYTIRYNANGGTGTVKNTTALGTMPVQLEKSTFTKENYRFAGWNKNTSSSEVQYQDEELVSGINNDELTVDLYAVWSDNITVTFNPNSGSVTQTTKVVKITENYGELPTPTRTGYTFTGWYTAASGGTKITADTIVTEVKHQTLYAQWRINKIYVKYNVNGGTIATSSVYNEKAYTWRQDDDGYIFYSIDGGAEKQQMNSINYGSSLGSSGLTNYNSSTLMNITKAGYSGASSGLVWKCLEGCTTSGATFDQTTAYAGSKFCDASKGDCTVTIGVNWAANTYTITYYLGNATSTAGVTKLGTSTCTYNASCTLKTFGTSAANGGIGGIFPYGPDDKATNGTANYGWYFYGWSTSKTGTTRTYKNSASFTYKTAGNVSLYALGYRSVYFYGGIAPTTYETKDRVYQYWNPYSTSATYLTSVTIPDKTAISGWTFVGYVLGSNTASATVTQAASTIGTTIKPAYSAGRTYRSIYKRTLTVKYNANGGSGTVANQTKTQYYNTGYASSGANVGANVSTAAFELRANAFTKSGYGFSTWAVGSASGTKKAAGATYNFAPAVTSTSTTKTMYAIWDTKQTGSFTVDFWADETFTKQVTFPNAFSSAPTVTHTKSCGSFCQNWEHISKITVSNVTKTGFKLTVTGDGDGSQGITFKFEWTATAK